MNTLHDDPLWPRAGGWPSWQSGDYPSHVAFVGVPTFARSLSPTHAHETPNAVRDALRRYSFETDLTVVDAGNYLQARDLVMIETHLMVAVGGDNSATVPVASARNAAGLVTLDAHHDLRDGSSNGSPVRELIETGVPGTRVVQVGIEPFANSRAYAERAAELGITVVYRDELRRRPMEDVMAEALSIASAGGGSVHVDLDVDVCDRSVAPACPASVPGGISAIELRTAARLAGAHPSVGSIDLVEVDSTADTADGRTVRLVALCVLEAIAGFGER